MTFEDQIPELITKRGTYNIVGRHELTKEELQLAYDEVVARYAKMGISLPAITVGGKTNTRKVHTSRKQYLVKKKERALRLLSDSDLKTCRKCGEAKPYSQFHKAKPYGDGHVNRCKECCSKYQKDYWAKIK